MSRLWRERTDALNVLVRLGLGLELIDELSTEEREREVTTCNVGYVKKKTEA